MKQHSLVVCLLFLFHSMTYSQAEALLLLEDNKLKGKCEHQYFNGFKIELDSTYSKLDSTMLFNQLPRIGSIRFKNRVDIPTEFTLTNRAGIPQIMFRFRTSYLTFDNLKINDQSISFSINSDPEVPVREEDLKIVKLAKKLLSDENNWNDTADRNCQDDLANNSFSIYCALRISSLEVESKYNHRNAVLQKLRHLIAEKYPDRKWNHRLMDYNNMKETSHPEIIDILDKIEQEFIKELEKRKL